MDINNIDFEILTYTTMASIIGFTGLLSFLSAKTELQELIGLSVVIGCIIWLGMIHIWRIRRRNIKRKGNLK